MYAIKSWYYAKRMKKYFLQKWPGLFRWFRFSLQTVVENLFDLPKNHNQFFSAKRSWVNTPALKENAMTLIRVQAISVNMWIILILNYEYAPKSLINWILSEAEECNHLLMKTLRLRSVSCFALKCLLGVGAKRFLLSFWSFVINLRFSYYREFLYNVMFSP